jgi:hypothetical protein
MAINRLETLSKMHRTLDAFEDREQESIYHVEKANARYLQFTEITKKITLTVE